jgi:hypothetical protein
MLDPHDSLWRCTKKGDNSRLFLGQGTILEWHVKRSHVWLFIGVPNEIIQRAASVLEDIHSKRPIKRVTWDKLATKDQQHQVITYQQIDTFFIEKRHLFLWEEKRHLWSWSFETYMSCGNFRMQWRSCWPSMHLKVIWVASSKRFSLLSRRYVKRDFISPVLWYKLAVPFRCTMTISRRASKVAPKCILHIIILLFITQQSSQCLTQKTKCTPAPPQITLFSFLSVWGRSVWRVAHPMLACRSKQDRSSTHSHTTHPPHW